MITIGKAIAQAIPHVTEHKTESEIVPSFNVKRFHIVTHSNADSFSIKTIFYEIKNIFYLKCKRNNF